MNKRQKSFVDHVRQECKKYGIKCDLRPVKYLKLSGNIKCSGYFDETTGVLACATNREDWLSILVHEYAHLTQWVDDCSQWKTMTKLDSCNKMDMWLSGKRIKNYETHIDVMKELELDNEKRSVKIIKQFGLDRDIDVKNYVRKANAYVHFYNYMKITRRWSQPSNPPYSNETIISVMSDRFGMKYTSMSKRVKSAFVKAGI